MYLVRFFPATPALQRTESTRKNVPQPSNPLKSFNWSKLPDAKVQGTIWSELDDTKLYTNIELESIDKLFSAYQKNGVTVIIIVWNRCECNESIAINYLPAEWRIGRGLAFDGETAIENFISHRWTACSELHHSLEQIENVRWGYFQVRNNVAIATCIGHL